MGVAWPPHVPQSRCLCGRQLASLSFPEIGSASVQAWGYRDAVPLSFRPDRDVLPVGLSWPLLFPHAPHIPAAGPWLFPARGGWLLASPPSLGPSGCALAFLTDSAPKGLCSGPPAAWSSSPCSPAVCHHSRALTLGEDSVSVSPMDPGSTWYRALMHSFIHSGALCSVPGTQMCPLQSMTVSRRMIWAHLCKCTQLSISIT